MAIVLATTENKVRFYKFDPAAATRGAFTLCETLHVGEIPQFGDKGSAKLAALALGLRTWRYVRF